MQLRVVQRDLKIYGRVTEQKRISETLDAMESKWGRHSVDLNWMQGPMRPRSVKCVDHESRRFDASSDCIAVFC
jgi:hypothetical protein